MRRNIGTILTALGAFLVVTGLLVRFYAYPNVAVGQLQAQDTVTRLEAKDATVFSIAELKPVTTNLSVAATTRSDPAAANKEGGRTVVWAGTTTVQMSDGTIVSQDASSTAFDGLTAEAKNCCGNFVEANEGERVPVKRSGLVYKFPFNTQKKTYQFFDDSAGRSYPAKFVGEQTIKGVKTYKFVQEIPRQQIGEREVPASILGEPGDDPVMAGQYYKNTRTFFVEPNTGAFINRIEEQYQTLTWQGEDRVIATDATVQFTPAQIDKFVDQLGQGAVLGLVRNVIPWVMLALGLALAALGVMMTRRRGGAKAAA